MAKITRTNYPINELLVLAHNAIAGEVGPVTRGSGAERRGAYRVRTEYVARVALTGSDDLIDESEVFDLSSGGARLLSGLQMDIGQRVSVSFGSSQAAVNLAGTVRHVKRDRGRSAYGVAWDPLPAPDNRQLQHILLDCLARDAAADAEALVASAKGGESPEMAAGVTAAIVRQLVGTQALVTELQGLLLRAEGDPASLYAAQEVTLGLRAAVQAMAALLQAAQAPTPAAARRRPQRRA